MKLWYTKRAMEWTEALPIGNGHMGAMCYGGEEGRYDLSENTCWSGEKAKNDLNDHAGEAMARARRFLTEKKPKEAILELEQCVGKKNNYGTQVPMGRLFVTVLEDADSVMRELFLENGVVKDTLIYKDKIVKRESFLSNVSKILAVKVFAEGKILPSLCLWSEGASQPCKTLAEKNTLVVHGHALENIHSDGKTGVSYFMRLDFQTDGEVSWSRRGLIINNATYLTVSMASATSMFETDMENTCKKQILEATEKGFEMLLEEHKAEHSALMNACTFTMGKTGPDMPTDKRIAAFKENQNDLELVTMFFQYGRYLIMNSTRPDSLLPAALQGVWNDDRACRMQWTDDIHLDINTQMNYYPTEITGLGACTPPLFTWIKNILMPNGKKVAKELYKAEGWCAHTVSNAFGWAAPGWDVEWGFSLTCGAWIATHIWDHYLFTQDVDFLDQYYEVLYESAQFLNSVLTVDPETGEFVTNPSYSPENVYTWKGKGYNVTTGSTFDSVVTKKMFSIVMQAAKILDKEDGFTLELENTLKKLPAFKIGKHGQLQEWNTDFDEFLPDHRHTSHLLALHPFNMINPKKDKELTEAVRISLDRRLGENAKDIIYANWAGALLITYYARLLEGEKAGNFVNPMISFLSRPNMMITHQGDTTSITGGIYELDGNTGFTAAVAEMLLQSYSGEIHILPAIPTWWSEGCVDGLCCYGGNKVRIIWDKKNIIVDLLANMDGKITVVHESQRKSIEVKKNTKYTLIFTKA